MANFLGDISVGYLKRQQEIEARDRSEMLARNKSILGGAAQFLQNSMEGMREEARPIAMRGLSELLLADPSRLTEKKARDIANKNLQFLWEGLSENPSPGPQTMSSTVTGTSSAPSAPAIPTPDIHDLFVGGNVAPGPMANRNVNLLPVTAAAEIPAPQPPEGYRRSVYPSEHELENKAYVARQMKINQDIDEAYQKTRAQHELDREFPKPQPLQQVNVNERLYDPNRGITLLEPDPTAQRAQNMQGQWGKLNGKEVFVFRDMANGREYIGTKNGLQEVTGKIERIDESGAFSAVTDQRGNILGWYNPKSNQRVTTEQAGFGPDIFKGPMSMDRQTRETAAASGMKSIADFRRELRSNPNLLAQLAIPGSPGARAAAAMRAEMTDVLTRVRTGAALNANEEEFYARYAPALLDTLFDDPATIEYKLGILEDNFRGLAPKNWEALMRRTPPSEQTAPPIPPPGGGPAAATNPNTRVYQGYEYTKDAKSGNWVRGRKVQ